MQPIITSLTAPAAEPISVDDAAAFCRVDDSSEYAFIESLIAVAREKIELRTGLALISQQFLLTRGHWSPRWNQDPATWHQFSLIADLYGLWNRYQNGECNVIRLERSPLLSIDAVQYYDANNALQTLDASNYIALGVLSPLAGGLNLPTVGALELKSTASWPVIYDRHDAVQIKFTAGYGTQPNHVPQTLRNAMRFCVKHFYDNRDAFVIGSGSAIELPHGLTDLMDSRRVGGWVA